jgi:hypothetical protein
MPYITASQVNTPAKLAEFVEEAKLGMLEVLNAELVPALPAVSGEKIPVVKNRRIIDLAPEDFASKLRSKRHVEGTSTNTIEKVHAFTVGYAGIDEDIQSETGHRQTTVGCKQYQVRFFIDSFYEDEVGTDTDNPEKRHAAEIARIAYALSTSRTLRRPGVVQRIGGFRERRGFVRMGEAVIRQSQVEISIILEPVPLVRSA